MTDQTTTPEETPSTEAEVLAAQVHNKIDKPFRVVSKEEQDKKVALWLVTFTDIMALMLTFFVLLYTMSSPKEQEWTQMTAALGRDLGRQFAPPANRGTQDTINIDKVDFSKALDLSYLGVLLKETLKNNPQAEGIMMINRGGPFDRIHARFLVIRCRAGRCSG